MAEIRLAQVTPPNAQYAFAFRTLPGWFKQVTKMTVAVSSTGANLTIVEHNIGANRFNLDDEDDVHYYARALPQTANISDIWSPGWNIMPGREISVLVSLANEITVTFDGWREKRPAEAPEE